MSPHRSRSIGAAYALVIFLGGFGAHRFYLGRVGSAVAILCLTIFAGIAAAVGATTHASVLWLTGVGGIAYVVVGIWLIVDLFLIPSMARGGR